MSVLHLYHAMFQIDTPAVTLKGQRAAQDKETRAGALEEAGRTGLDPARALVFNRSRYYRFLGQRRMC